MQGYDKFFKEARKAGSAAQGKRPAARPQASTKPQAGAGKRRFQIPMQQAPVETAEDRLKQIVRERTKRQRELARRKKAPFPYGAAATVVIGLFLAGVGVAVPESAEWVMSHVEIGVFGSAEAASDGKAADAKKAAAAAKSGEKNAGAEQNDAAKTAAGADATKSEASEAMPDTRQWTPEEVSFFNKLSGRKRELDLREAELNKLEEELQKQKVELDEKIKQLESMRTQIAQTLKSRVDNDQQKVSKLVEVYSGMKPQQAAKVMETLNEDLAVQVLDRMKKKSAADILNVMKAEKAQRLSEMLAGYKKPE